jgi:hypothetical protein
MFKLQKLLSKHCKTDGEARAGLMGLGMPAWHAWWFAPGRRAACGGAAALLLICPLLLRPLHAPLLPASRCGGRQ